MKFNCYDGFYYETSTLLTEYNIKHLFSTKKDDKRKNIEGTNFSFSNCTDKEETKKSYEKIARLFDVPYENITKSTQIHQDKILEIENKHIGMGISRETTIDNADGILTTLKDVPLCIFTADCTPVIIADKNKKVVSAVHSGWKGTALAITLNAIKIMEEKYNIKKEDILCAIGPSISRCCFEVSDDVILALNKVTSLEGLYDKKENGKYMLDLKGVNKRILINYGIPKENIDVSDSCTMCDDRFYSYRREGKTTGRNGAFILK